MRVILVLLTVVIIEFQLIIGLLLRASFFRRWKQLSYGLRSSVCLVFGCQNLELGLTTRDFISRVFAKSMVAAYESMSDTLYRLQ